MSKFGRVIRWILVIISGIILITGIVQAIQFAGQDSGKDAMISWIVTDVIIGLICIYNIMCIVEDEHIIIQLIKDGRAERRDTVKEYKYRSEKDTTDRDRKRGDRKIKFRNFWVSVLDVLKWPFKKIKFFFAKRKILSNEAKKQKRIDEIIAEYKRQGRELTYKEAEIIYYREIGQEYLEDKGKKKKKNTQNDEGSIKQKAIVAAEPHKQEFIKTYNKWFVTRTYETEDDKILYTQYCAEADIKDELSHFKLNGFFFSNEKFDDVRKIYPGKAGVFAFRKEANEVDRLVKGGRNDSGSVNLNWILQERIKEADRMWELRATIARIGYVGIEPKDFIWMNVRYDTLYYMRIREKEGVDVNELLKGVYFGLKELDLDANDAWSKMFFDRLYSIPADAEELYNISKFN